MKIKELHSEVTFMPFPGIKGKIFRGNRPVISENSAHHLIKYSETYKITEIILLCTEKECEIGPNLNLKKAYIEAGYRVIHFPIIDYSVPDIDRLKELIETTSTLASTGKTILIHCIAGQGRTGLILACLARKHLNCSGDSAINWVRSHIPKALETPVQCQMVKDFIS